MLARSGRLPSSGDFACAVKWDGSGAIVSTEGELRVRSRRADFRQFCECVLQRRESIPLTFMAFDVLSVEGESVAARRGRKRRRVPRAVHCTRSRG
jgi:ATP-dependent DNA ligase